MKTGTDGFFLNVATNASTKPTRPPMSIGAMFGLGLATVTLLIVQIQPTTAVTTRMANRPRVLKTVSSTVMRSVCTAPADGAAYMPSMLAVSAAAAAAVIDWAGGGL